MGDRANVVIVKGDEQVCLYTHSNGSNLPLIVSRGIARAIKDRREDDFQYFNRIIFCEMLKFAKADLDDTIGFGISQEVHDGGNKIVYINLDYGTVELQSPETEGHSATLKEFSTLTN